MKKILAITCLVLFALVLSSKDQSLAAEVSKSPSEIQAFVNKIEYRVTTEAQVRASLGEPTKVTEGSSDCASLRCNKTNWKKLHYSTISIQLTDGVVTSVYE